MLDHVAFPRYARHPSAILDIPDRPPQDPGWEGDCTLPQALVSPAWNSIYSSFLPSFENTFERNCLVPPFTLPANFLLSRCHWPIAGDCWILSPPPKVSSSPSSSSSCQINHWLCFRSDWDKTVVDPQGLSFLSTPHKPWYLSYSQLLGPGGPVWHVLAM